MARVEQSIKVVLTVRRPGTTAATLRSGLAALETQLDTDARTRLALGMTGVAFGFKFQAVSLGANRYQLYPRLVVRADTELERPAIRERWNSVRDGIVSHLTAHAAAIGATVLDTHTKDYTR